MINEELVAHDHTCNQKCSMMSRAKELFIVMDKPVLLTTIQEGRQGFRIKIDFHWTENDADGYCELANIDLSCFGYKNWWVKDLKSLVSWKAFLYFGELNGNLRVHCCLSRIVWGSENIRLYLAMRTQIMFKKLDIWMAVHEGKFWPQEYHRGLIDDLPWFLAHWYLWAILIMHHYW